MENLWLEWRKHYENIGIDPHRICQDGPINSEFYSKTQPKILFVMKEVNNWPGGNLSDLLKNGPKYQMWHTISRWAFGLINDFPAFETIDWPAKTKAIRSIATINLKKTSGTASSNISIVNAYTFRDRLLLRKQISAIDPDVIVTCGTYDQLVWLLELKVNPDAPLGAAVLAQNPPSIVIPFRHPARCNNRKTYKELKKLVENFQIHYALTKL